MSRHEIAGPVIRNVGMDPQRDFFALALERGTPFFFALGLLSLVLAIVLWIRPTRNVLLRRGASAVCLILVCLCACALHFTRSVNAALTVRAGNLAYRLLSDDTLH